VPLGILYVAAAVRDGGTHDVSVVDLCFADDPIVAVREAVAAYRPEVVGLGLRNLHDNTYGSSEALLAYYDSVARAIRDVMPERCRLVLGGAAITLQPSTMLERLNADHAIVGEGEHTFRDLIDTLARGEEPARILSSGAVNRARTGIIASSSLTSSPTSPKDKDKDKDKHKETRAPAPAIAAAVLDELTPPARDLVDTRYFDVEGTDNIQTKRGCAFQCTYCDYPDLEGRKVRVRNPDAIADEMLARSKVPGVTHAFIVDSVFNVPRSHALATCDALIARGSPLPWVCYVSPASLDDEVVAKMAQAGCIGAEIGTDSGSPRVLERLKKPFTLDQVRRVREAFKKHNISDCHTFVLGAEEETVDEARATLAFIEELDPDVAVFVVFMEDREEHDIRRATHRDAILELLATEAPRRPGWVVPELSIRFGPKVTRLVRREHMRGPAWVHLARARRRELMQRTLRTRSV
jgi:radical SAM superfamily enzyme YgiQ (UPF0313 family)